MVHPIKGHTCCAEVTHVDTELVDTRAILVAIVTSECLPFPEGDWEDQLKRVEISSQLLLTLGHLYFTPDTYFTDT